LADSCLCGRCRSGTGPGSQVFATGWEAAKAGWEAGKVCAAEATELDADPAPTPAPEPAAAPATNAPAPAPAATRTTLQRQLDLQQLLRMGYSVRAATRATSVCSNLDHAIDWLGTHSSEPEPVSRRPKAEIAERYGEETYSYITMEQVVVDTCLKCGHYCNSAELWDWYEKNGEIPKCLTPGCLHVVNMENLPPRAKCTGAGPEGAITTDDDPTQVSRQLEHGHNLRGCWSRQRACPCGDEHCMHGRSAQAAIMIDDDPTQVCHLSPTQEELDRCRAACVKEQSERMAELMAEKAATDEAKRLRAVENAPSRRPAVANAGVSPTEKPSRKKQKTQEQLQPPGPDRQLGAFRSNLPPNCTPFTQGVSLLPDQQCMCTCCTFQGEPCTELASEEFKWLASDGRHMSRFLCTRCWNSEKQQRSNEEAVELGGCHSGAVVTVGATAAAAGEAPEGKESTEPDGSGTDNAWHCEGCGSSFEGQHAAEHHEAACNKYLALIK
jgi:hypothetical protein